MPREKRQAKFVIKPDGKGQFNYSLVAANGEVLAQNTQGFRDPSAATRGIKSLVRSAAEAVKNIRIGEDE